MSSAQKTSVIIPTYERADQLRQTLGYLALCTPAPAEILVHIDFGDRNTEYMLKAEFPGVVVLQSLERQGPGGGRNKLYHAATHECLVSLDDDSWPMDETFFSQAQELMESHPEVAVFGCGIQESDGILKEFPAPTPQPEHEETLKPASNFVGCGAILRRSALINTRGYVSLHQAYGMEEADMTLQLIDQGWEIRSADHLQVFHACDRITYHALPGINAAHIRNVALLAWIRYPIWFFPYAFLQLLNRLAFSLKHRRFRGILSGICSILPACWSYRRLRSPVSVKAVREFRELRKQEAAG
ncbi:MAG: glycosyltransferase family 2 protein [Planctomycetaceae bacterium]|jgi:GT2 family glycosyltransferase|nr:glycosyltransferase family 2 protein [Planctomycetaceae bacterium]